MRKSRGSEVLSSFAPCFACQKYKRVKHLVINAPSPHPLPQAWGRGKGEGEIRNVKRINAFVFVTLVAAFGCARE
jgi:hypothetical protein